MSPKTARKHLNSLGDEGFVATEFGDHGATYYRRLATSLVVEQAADIRAHVSTDELIGHITELRATISDFQDECGVESPEELTVERANQALAENASEREGIDADALQEWQTVRRNLAFANAALAIGNTALRR